MLTISGHRVIPLAQELVWSRLLDPRVLQRCVPGCRHIESPQPLLFRLVVKVGHGLIKGKFRGEVRLVDVVEPSSCRLDWFTRGMAGAIEGATRVSLSPMDSAPATEVRFQGEARVRGLLRTLSRSVFQEAIDSFTEEFFDEISREDLP